jgi:hypothetical protein
LLSFLLVCKYVSECLWPLEILSFDKNKLWYECKTSWNKIVKGTEILILKGFDVVYVESMVGEWCGILIIHK